MSQLYIIGILYQDLVEADQNTIRRVGKKQISVLSGPQPATSEGSPTLSSLMEGRSCTF